MADTENTCADCDYFNDEIKDGFAPGEPYMSLCMIDFDDVMSDQEACEYFYRRFECE